jgi:hypothetical protein
MKIKDTEIIPVLYCLADTWLVMTPIFANKFYLKLSEYVHVNKLTSLQTFYLCEISNNLVEYVVIVRGFKLSGKILDYELSFIESMNKSINQYLGFFNEILKEVFADIEKMEIQYMDGDRFIDPEKIGQLEEAKKKISNFEL